MIYDQMYIYDAIFQNEKWNIYMLDKKKLGEILIF